MSLRVCIGANTIRYPESGGHLWAYLNWALGFRSLGVEVIWMEGISGRNSVSAIREAVAALKRNIGPYGLADRVALWSETGEPLDPEAQADCLEFALAAESDLLLDVRHETPGHVLRQFRKTAFLDIDPGLTQIWAAGGQIAFSKRDLFFTIGETVGRPGSNFPDVGLQWNYTPPCVALDWWPVQPACPNAPFTTVSHWSGGGWIDYNGELYCNNKREGFMRFIDLPRRTGHPLELAVCLGKDEDDERAMLCDNGWRVRDSCDVVSSPWDYQRYIQASAGEFSCAKPSCARLQNGWVSDRTLCYLASGKPVVVQHTGPSRILPDRAGMFRFRTAEEAVEALEAARADYERQSALARALAERHFDARTITASLLEKAL